jgi:hypothetical protein
VRTTIGASGPPGRKEEVNPGGNDVGTDTRHSVSRPEAPSPGVRVKVPNDPSSGLR